MSSACIVITTVCLATCVGAALGQETDQRRYPTTEPVVVTASPSGEGSYVAPEATTATKSDLPIRDIPQAIEVRSQQILEDLGGRQTAYEVGRTVAGVFNASNGAGDPGINAPVFFIRGYSNAGVYLKDGAYRIGWFSTMDMAYVDRVEFLKGPASVLYGSAIYGGNVGGVVNYVSKSPTPSAVSEIGLVAGSYDFLRATADFDRALNPDATAMLRINAALEQGRSIADYARHDQQAVAPALTLQLSPADRLTLLTDFTHARDTPASRLPISPDALTVSRSRNFIDPAFAKDDFNNANAALKYQRISATTGASTWTTRTAMQPPTITPTL
jgi:iron complex outermembrane receptor protein